MSALPFSREPPRRGTRVMKQAKRPYVICHMVPSVDGRIVTLRWRPPPRLHAEYERTAGTFDAGAWMIGHVSMEPWWRLSRTARSGRRRSSTSRRRARRPLGG